MADLDVGRRIALGKQGDGQGQPQLDPGCAAVKAGSAGTQHPAGEGGRAADTQPLQALVGALVQRDGAQGSEGPRTWGR